MKKVAIIIVNWNGLKFLKDCLESVFNQTYQNFDVYFVDNGSVDDSVDFVSKNFPQVKIMRLDTNTGFAKGNNIGIREAFKDEKVFKVIYFYIFGAFLSFLFFDTPFGLDRWGAWQFFGAHAAIVWLAVYGWRVFGYKPNIKNLYQSMVALIIYGLISGYATFKYGGSDELFLKNPPVDFLQFLVDINQVVYVIVFSILAAILMYAAYIPVIVSNRILSKK